MFPGLDHLLSHAVPFALVLARLAGLFIFAPLLSSIVIPMRLKAIMVLVMAVATYPLLPSVMVGPGDMDIFTLAPAMVIESGLGAVIGILAAAPLLSLEMSGVLIGQQMGFGLAKVFNPEANFDTDLLGQILFYIAAGAFLSAGGLETMFGSLIHTFERVPLGGFQVAQTPLDLMTGVIISGFELAWRVAAPVTGMILLLVVVMGILGKTMPQINIMSVGFTAKILAGLAILTASLYASQGAVWDEVNAVLGQVVRWVGGLG
ncbi:MAG: flagellar biosynthetic protein FliR [Phycisphaerales bacterium]|nr:flagellar biosynthetic protein FliR [Phycisphaerales bacterium]